MLNLKKKLHHRRIAKMQKCNAQTIRLTENINNATFIFIKKHTKGFKMKIFATKMGKERGVLPNKYAVR